MSAKRDAEILVVGAGPTGLLAAALLARSGTHVRIIDKSPSQAKESRAFAVQARTLEILLSAGLSEAFLDRGVLATGARIYVDGQFSAGFGFEALGRTDTPYPVVLILPQSETEAILVDDLRQHGIEVERGFTADDLSQDQDGVTVRMTGPDGPRTLTASYVVGADGAHSFVRKALGLSFSGAPYAQTFLLADCRVEGPVEDGPFSVFFHGPDFALWFPLKGDRTGRVITTSRQAIADASITTQGSSAASLPEVEESFRRASNLDVRLSDPVWVSRYRVHHRGVDRYGSGRVFVAGDAAHIHSPAGGQGMNTGMQDAANLAWKLALAIRQEDSRPALLDSYDAERRPLGEAVLAATDRVFSLATSSSRWVSAARDVVLPLVGATIGRSGALRSRAFHLLSELGISYDPGPATAADGSAWTQGPRPGHRAPDAAIGRKLSVFDLIGGYRFNLLAFARKPLSAPEIERLAGELEAFAAGCQLGLEAHLVAHSLVGRHPGLIQAENDLVMSVYGLSGTVMQALYLIRPDGHVAWRAPSLDVAGCRRFMKERFFRPSAP